MINKKEKTRIARALGIETARVHRMLVQDGPASIADLSKGARELIDSISGSDHPNDQIRGIETRDFISGSRRLKSGERLAIIELDRERGPAIIGIVP